MSWRTKGRGKGHKHYQLKPRKAYHIRLGKPSVELRVPKGFTISVVQVEESRPAFGSHGFIYGKEAGQYQWTIYKNGKQLALNDVIGSRKDVIREAREALGDILKQGGKASKVHVTANTKVRVFERGEYVTKPISKVLPPKSWLERAVKALKKRKKVKIYNPAGLAASMWWNMRPQTKLEIMKREGKFKRFV